jgi:nitronate monooxygenase
MWLKASLHSAGIDLDKLPKPVKRGTDHLPSGVKPWSNVWSAGQGIGQIDDIPTVAALVRRLQSQYVAACSTHDMSKAATAALQKEP